MLLVALPVTCYLVGGLLILVTLVAVGLFLLKSREVASLKKEVEDLRDTMRMMRYEEASLSRMLHTVDKSSVSPSMSEQAETPGAEDNLGALVAMESQELEVVDLPAEESVGESTEELIDSISQESVEESQTMMVVEEPVEEDVLIEIEEEYSITDEHVQAMETKESVEEELVASEKREEVVPEIDTEELFVADKEEDDKTAEEKSSSSDGPAGPIATKVEVESEAKPEEETAVETQMEQPKVEPAARKQAINERRPAIPHDLFSAWFAENEDIEAEKKQMETDAPIKPE